ncbi:MULTISPECIES: hypothetical protein [Cryobacterium]|nr:MULTISPECIES: hypothetical protein [Cryobacterium]
MTDSATPIPPIRPETIDAPTTQSVDITPFVTEMLTQLEQRDGSSLTT